MQNRTTGFHVVPALLLCAICASAAPVTLTGTSCNPAVNSLNSTFPTNGIHVAGRLLLFPNEPGCATSWTIDNPLTLAAGTYSLQSDLNLNIIATVDQFLVPNVGVGSCGSCAVTANNNPVTANINMVSSIVGTATSTGALRDLPTPGAGNVSGSSSIDFAHAGGLLTLRQVVTITFNITGLYSVEADLNLPASARSQVVAAQTPPIPEPSTAGLLLLGGATAWLLRRRRAS
jgi:hypothetical protein